MKDWRRIGLPSAGWRDRRAGAALEFGFVALPAIALLLMVLEISFDLFTQAVLDSGLAVAARQLQTGNAQNAQNGASFITSYLCPPMRGLLNCSNLYIKVQRISPSSTQDYYDYTTGVAPGTAGSLDLSSFSSASFCNSGPSTLLLISAVYVGPTLVGSLLPNSLAVTYNGQQVHPTLSTVGIVSEGYAPQSAPTGTASAC